MLTPSMIRDVGRLDGVVAPRFVLSPFLAVRFLVYAGVEQGTTPHGGGPPILTK